jgi:hypothetical protein
MPNSVWEQLGWNMRTDGQSPRAMLSLIVLLFGNKVTSLHVLSILHHLSLQTCDCLATLGTTFTLLLAVNSTAF